MEVTILKIDQYSAHNPDFDATILANRKAVADFDVAMTDWVNQSEEDRGDRPLEPSLTEVPSETKPMFQITFSAEDRGELVAYVDVSANDADIAAAITAAVEEAASRHSLSPGDTITI